MLRPSSVRPPAMNVPVAGSMTLPTALTATSAATTRPSGSSIAALPMPPFIARSRAQQLARPSRPRRRRRCLRRPRPCVAARAAAIAAIGSRTNPRVADPKVEQNRRRHNRHDAAAESEADPLLLEISASRRRRPRARTRCRRTSTIACTCWTQLTGLSRSVSRVPGAPPRTSTPATRRPPRG